MDDANLVNDTLVATSSNVTGNDFTDLILMAVFAMAALFFAMQFFKLRSLPLFRTLRQSKHKDCYCAMIHNPDNSVSFEVMRMDKFVNAKMEGVGKSAKSIGNEIYVSPRMNDVESYGKGEYKIVHYLRGSTQPLQAEDAAFLSEVQNKLYESGLIEKPDDDAKIYKRKAESTASFLVLFELVEQISDNIEIVALMNPGSTDLESASGTGITVEDVIRIRSIYDDIKTEPFYYQKSKQFLNLVQESSTVSVQTLLDQALSAEMVKNGGVLNKTNGLLGSLFSGDNNMMIIILAIPIAIGVFLLFW